MSSCWHTKFKQKFGNCLWNIMLKHTMILKTNNAPKIENTNIKYFQRRKLMEYWVHDSSEWIPTSVQTCRDVLNHFVNPRLWIVTIRHNLPLKSLNYKEKYWKICKIWHQIYLGFRGAAIYSTRHAYTAGITKNCLFCNGFFSLWSNNNFIIIII